MGKPVIVITNISARFYYYQWFIYGLMLLEREGRIDLRFKVPFFQKLCLVPYSGFIIRCIRKAKYLLGRTGEVKVNNYFQGFVWDGNQRYSFCIDSADSPNMFCGRLLSEVDTYFKIQCPKEFDRRGFRLGNVWIPYFDVEYRNSSDKGKLKAPRKLCPDVYEYAYKIRPLLLAVRSMGTNCSFRELDARYKRLLSARNVKQTQKAMCYFGDAKGPKPSAHVTDPDYDWEADILGYYGDKMNHPNEKRAKIADILKSLGDGYDARIINDGNSDQGKASNKGLIIPLKDFSKHVAKFQYNVNVSGYRMSIPARFIDSFICGTAIATDNLSVKWYHPFGDEVCEIGEMGYLPDNEVDYPAIKEKLKTLKPGNKDYVIEQYEKYWSPKAVAEYMVDTVLKRDNRRKSK